MGLVPRKTRTDVRGSLQATHTRGSNAELQWYLEQNAYSTNGRDGRKQQPRTNQFAHEHERDATPQHRRRKRMHRPGLRRRETSGRKVHLECCKLAPSWTRSKDFDCTAHDHEFHPLHAQHPCHWVRKATDKIAGCARSPRRVEDGHEAGLQQENVPLHSTAIQGQRCGRRGKCCISPETRGIDHLQNTG